MRRQKMWVRPHEPEHPGDFAWEVGCQCCGYVVFATWEWGRAMRAAREHSFRHRA